MTIFGLKGPELNRDTYKLTAILYRTGAVEVKINGQRSCDI